MSRAGGGRKSRKAGAFIAALLTEATLTAAAAKVGISLATAKRWRADPAIAAELSAARDQLVDEVVAALERAGLAAVESLVKALNAKSAAVKNQAAIALIDRLFKGTALVGLRRRLATLERIAGLNGTVPSRPAGPSYDKNTLTADDVIGAEELVREVQRRRPDLFGDGTNGEAL